MLASAKLAKYLHKSFTIQYNTIQYNTIQDKTRQDKTTAMQYNTMQCNNNNDTNNRTEQYSTDLYAFKYLYTKNICILTAKVYNKKYIYRTDLKFSRSMECKNVHKNKNLNWLEN